MNVGGGGEEFKYIKMVINHLCLLRNSKDSLLFDFKKYTLKGEGKFYFDQVFPLPLGRKGGKNSSFKEQQFKFHP